MGLLRKKLSKINWKRLQFWKILTSLRTPAYKLDGTVEQTGGFNYRGWYVQVPVKAECSKCMYVQLIHARLTWTYHWPWINNAPFRNSGSPILIFLFSSSCTQVNARQHALKILHYWCFTFQFWIVYRNHVILKFKDKYYFILFFI